MSAPHACGYEAFNPGAGSSRFAPFTDASGAVVPSPYGGEDETVALLEATFHEVAGGDRILYESRLREEGLVHAVTPVELGLLDLRDRELARLGLSRRQLVAAGADHYPCTREWARYLHGRSYRSSRPHELLWHSRQAELDGEAPSWVFVLFGDRAPTGPGSLPLTGPGVPNLVEGCDDTDSPA